MNLEKKVYPVQSRRDLCGAWLISVNMGYGHQRTAFALKDLAINNEIINANDYEGIPENDKRTWEMTRRGYEAVSSFKRFPLIGNLVFSAMDYFQRILGFYPKRDLSQPNFQLKQIFSLIRRGWGKDLMEKLKVESLKLKIQAEREFSGGSKIGGIKVNVPIITTFFTPAFMAEFFQYPGEIFCVVCDADISRTWASFDPVKSKIKYFAPTERVAKRLKFYGVSQENIFFTGYPLPAENIGSKDMEIVKGDLKLRLLNLDPKKEYFNKYKVLIEEELGIFPEKSDHPLTLMFAVGGAGAQKEIASKILKSLSEKIKTRAIKVILVAGIKEKIKEYFKKNIKKIGLEGAGVEIIFGRTIEDYFKNFNFALRKTDMLWTKPSELSFYSALGIPVIIAPAMGSQEEFNKRWLQKSGFGLAQENPGYVHEWLFDWINSGYLAEAAFEGFIEGEKTGVYKIKNIICP